MQDLSYFKNFLTRFFTRMMSFVLDFIDYGMVAFLYAEGIQLTAAHSGGRCSDFTQEEVQHLRRYNLYSQGKYFNEFSSHACWLFVL